MTSDRETIDTYTAKAADYAALEVTETQARALARFLEGLAPGSALFDLGCGPGVHAERMLAAGHSVAALDATPAFVEAARARGVEARLGTFDDLTETAAYDGVWASFSLLHAPRDAMPRHLAAIARALKPGGRLFLGMKTGSGAHRDDLGRLYTYYSEDELSDLLRDAGFVLEHSESGAEAGLSGTPDPFVLIYAHA
jgi:SAM-dependent methyltransferase